MVCPCGQIATLRKRSRLMVCFHGAFPVGGCGPGLEREAVRDRRYLPSVLAAQHENGAEAGNRARRRLRG